MGLIVFNSFNICIHTFNGLKTRSIGLLPMETSPDKTLSIPKPLNKPANNRVVVPELPVYNT